MHLVGWFMWMLKWVFFQPFIRFKMLFAQCEILSLPDSKAVIKLSSILQSNTENYSTSWAVTTAMSLCLGHKNGRPLIRDTLYKQSKNYFIYVQKYFFKFLWHFLLFSLFYISSYSGYYMPRLILLLYFSLCWWKPFSAIKTGNRTCNWQTPNLILWLCSNFNTNIKLECLVSHSKQSRTECLEYSNWTGRHRTGFRFGTEK
jgi:hypothetical protein